MTKTLIAMLMAISAVPAMGEQPIVASSTVQIADLDLSSASGQRTFDRRLQQAVKEVCGSASDADVAGKNDVRRCRAETYAGLIVERNLRIARASSEPMQVAAR